MVVWEDGWVVSRVSMEVAPGHEQYLLARASPGKLQEPLQCLKAVLRVPPSQRRRLALLLFRQQYS